MRPFRRNKLKRVLLALAILSFVPLNYAQISKTDSLEKIELMTKKGCQTATPKKENSNKPTDSIKTKKDSLDISRCFENGFLFKQKPLSNI
ncbi:hypothetical protein [Carboxylicivirga caseinilyticus]|uniref:hypothetical protein n=1 Tax=Carboxylicivirga caseinilyticus TaxID=3417572 RepID=UPI003D354457|nr:hypothetical protein [Marinilabiliaceae bacterium A049]